MLGFRPSSFIFGGVGFKTGFLFIALFVLELALQTRLASESDILLLLFLLSAWIKSIHHYG